MSKKQRGFEVVKDEHRTAFDVFTDEKKKTHQFAKEVKLPKRADDKSAGYDFYLPKELEVLPMQKTLLPLDVKAYMQENELLEIYIRSSLAIKQGLMLSNNVGIVDASYYNNEGNDGNITLALVNTTGKTIKLGEGERIAQGIFKNYLLADEDAPTSKERKGGMGSSGK